MRFVKKLFAVILCIMVICFSLVTGVSAANNTPTITVSGVTAAAGDTVTINIDISDNPGIMAMAFCITYDSDALSFKNYSKGYPTSYTVKDHPDKGHVSFVNVENKDKATEGTIISLLFEVNSNAKPGKHVITLANSNREKHGTKLHNSFSNSKQEFIVPKVVSGGVTIPETCENSGHKWSEWDIINPANCTETGLQRHVCVRCDLEEETTIPITHNFETEWTVDKAATPEEDGIMSRHCTQCDAVTDQFTFSYEEIGGGDDEDTSSDDISSDISSDDNSLGENSSEVSTPEENDSSDNDTSNTSSETTPNKKPIINNTIGEKVPLEEVEKFEDYQENVKPKPEEDKTDDTSSQQNSSATTSDSSDITIGATHENQQNESHDEPSFFKTTGGIITIILGSVLVIGTLVLCSILVIRNKKQ